MIKLKHLGEIEFLKNVLISKGFVIDFYIFASDSIIFRIKKNYSKGFNVEFDGNIIIEINLNYSYYFYQTLPRIKEVSYLVKRNKNNHISNDGFICYTTPERTQLEGWDAIDYFFSIDAYFNNYFEKEYIGIGSLIELEHGNAGRDQFMYMYSSRAKTVTNLVLEYKLYL